MHRVLRKWILSCTSIGLVVWIVIVSVWVLKRYSIPAFTQRQEPSNNEQTTQLSKPQTLPTPAELRFSHDNEVLMRTDNEKTKLEYACQVDALEALERCPKLRYDSLGPLAKASVIICFHDSETAVSLLHTIHSVIQRSPEELLEEIIVIDDFSKKDEFGKFLEIYLRTVFAGKVKLHRNDANVGLIRSRQKGSRLAKGPVLVFMDSHSEVQKGWLEPLLFEIKKDRRSLVNSVIDWMEKIDDNWSYKYGCTMWTVVFDWSMGFGWNGLPSDEQRRNVTDIVRSRTIIGTYYAIDKQFFVDIGEFDNGMEFWGGENLDLSIRAVDAGDLTQRMVVRSAAPHDFRWYLENVMPHMSCPTKDGLALGPIRNYQTKLCLTGAVDGTLTMTQCSLDDRSQKIFWGNNFTLQEPSYAFVAEANLEKVTRQEMLFHYGWSTKASGWIHWEHGPIMDMYSNRCLEASVHDVKLVPCSYAAGNEAQLWHFETYSEQYASVVNLRTMVSAPFKRQQQILAELYRSAGAAGTQSNGQVSSNSAV